MFETSNPYLQTTRLSRTKLYLEMCRIDNLPASFIFVAGGAVAATHRLGDVLSPSVLLAALCTVLITATSMVVNDYFDFRVGTDEGDEGNVLARKALLPAQAKYFAARTYGALMFLICLAPFASVRVILMSGTISTFLYTKYLKPVTWMKNVSVASVCAFAPAVGGICACGGLGSLFTSSGGHCLGLSAALFFGIMHREILMDVVDVKADKVSGIITIPVKYGAHFASKVAVLLACAMGGVCLSMGRQPWGRWVGLLGASRMTFNAWAVTKVAKKTVHQGSLGSDMNGGIESGDLSRKCSVAIEESKLTFPAVLFSFL